MATMLDCKKIQPLLSEFVDGALAADTDWAVKLHIASCAVCAQVTSELQATAGLLSGLSAPEPSAGFETALAARLADRVLVARRASVWDRVRSAWTDWRMEPSPRPLARRPAFAVGSALALAALAPLAWFTVHGAPGGSGGANRINVAPIAASADASGLESLWSEHAAYSASAPLGDPSGVMLVSDMARGSGDNGGVTASPGSGGGSL